MRFLVDNALSPGVADALRTAGHDAVHVRAKGIQHAEDAVILEAALEERRILISADTDFGALLILGGRTRPSVILFREGSPRRPEKQADLLLRNLEPLTEDLESGAIVVFRRDRIRVRKLSARKKP